MKVDAQFPVTFNKTVDWEDYYSFIYYSFNELWNSIKLRCVRGLLDPFVLIKECKTEFKGYPLAFKGPNPPMVLL